MMENPSPYNAILGGEWLHAMGKVLSVGEILPHYPGIVTNNKRLNTREA